MIGNGDRLERQTLKISLSTRIKKGIIGIFLGGSLFIAALLILIWTEIQFVEVSKGLVKGKEMVQSISSSVIDPKYQDQLVHTSGFASTNDVLSDPRLNVTSMAPAIKLKRMVEMYQWQESKSETPHSIGGSTTHHNFYTYSKEWSSSPVNSNGFVNQEGHENPKEWEFKDYSWQAKNVQLGAFNLSKQQIKEINNYHDLEVTLVNFPEAIKDRAHILEEGYYIGRDPQNPEVGDLKISYAIVEPQMITVIAKQNNNTFEPYQTTKGDTISLIQSGEYSAKELFKEALADNSLITWILRALAFIGLWLGLWFILNFLVTFRKIQLFLGKMAPLGNGSLAFLLSTSLILIIIAAAWIVFRPFFSIILLLAGLGILYGLKYYRHG